MRKEENRILNEVRTYQQSYQKNSKDGFQALRETVILKFCKEDVNYGRKRLLNIISSFKELSKCN
jgi:hypothetical protein